MELGKALAATIMLGSFLLCLAHSERASGREVQIPAFLKRKVEAVDKTHAKLPPGIILQSPKTKIKKVVVRDDFAYVAGETSEEIAGCVGPHNGVSDIFLAAYNPQTGERVWCRYIRSGGPENIYEVGALAVDNKQDVIWMAVNVMPTTEGLPWSQLYHVNRFDGIYRLERTFDFSRAYAGEGDYFREAYAGTVLRTSPDDGTYCGVEVKAMVARSKCATNSGYCVPASASYAHIVGNVMFSRTGDCGNPKKQYFLSGGPNYLPHPSRFSSNAVANDIYYDSSLLLEGAVYVTGGTDAQLCPPPFTGDPTRDPCLEGYRNYGGMSDLFVVMHDVGGVGGAGTIKKLLQFGTDQYDEGISLAVCGGNTLWVAGHTRGKMAFSYPNFVDNSVDTPDDPTHPHPADSDVLLLRISKGEESPETHSIPWMRLDFGAQYGSSKDDQVSAAGCYSAGGVFLAGQTYGDLAETGTLPSQPDIFLTRIRDNFSAHDMRSFNIDWTRQEQTNTRDIVSDMARYNYNVVYNCLVGWSEGDNPQTFLDIYNVDGIKQLRCLPNERMCQHPLSP